MSWRGVKKSISRLPHQFKTRNGGEEVTKDVEYLDLEKKYKNVVKNGDEFRVEVLTYRDNLANLLNYQSLAANHLAELCGLKMEQSHNDQEDFSHDDYYYEDKKLRPELKQALEDYATAMAYCKQESFALLDDLDAVVLRPLDHFQTITKTINKTITKREHKLIDYDRFRLAYFKYTTISDPSPSEEKNMFKLQTQYDNAAYDYEYFNNMLKEELVIFLDLAQQLIQPIVENFYNIQCRAMGGIYSRFHEVMNHNSACFPTLDLPIEKGFELRLSQRNVREELDSSELFHKGPKPWEKRAPSFSSRPSYQYDESSDNEDHLSVQGYPSMNRSLSSHSSASSISNEDKYFESTKPTPPPLSARPAFLNNTRARSASSPNVPPPIRRPSYIPSPQSTNFTPPISRRPSFTPSPQSSLSPAQTPPISRRPSFTPSPTPPPVRASYGRRNTVSTATGSPLVAEVKKKRAPPPPPPSKKFSSAAKKEYVEALYELNGPQDGDLSFRVGDLIEVLEKSEKTEDWWKGRLGNQTGMFPANYVKPV